MPMARNWRRKAPGGKSSVLSWSIPACMAETAAAEAGSRGPGAAAMRRRRSRAAAIRAATAAPAAGAVRPVRIFTALSRSAASYVASTRRDRDIHAVS